MADESLLSRIKKLLKMAASGSGATESESATALAMAQKLLILHNLSLSDINLKDGESADSRLAHEQFEILNEDWRLALIQTIADANLCRVIRRRVPRHMAHMTWENMTVNLIGRETNRLVAKELYLWITAQIEGKGGLYHQAYGEEFGSRWAPKQSTKKPREFRYGFFLGITRRLCERIEAGKADTGNIVGCTALVLAHDAANKKYIDDTFNLVSGNGPQKISADAGAYRVGQSMGDRVSMAKHGIGGGGGPRALPSGR